MANRVPIQQLYDIFNKKYSEDIGWYEMYTINKKEIKHISRVFLSTIKDFASTIKIKTEKFPSDQLPKIIIKNKIKYIKLPTMDDLLFYDKTLTDFQHKCKFSASNRLVEIYLKNLIKNDDVDKLFFIFNTKILNFKNFMIERIYRNVDSSIYDFIKLYIRQYFYFSLFLKDKNSKVKIEELIDARFTPEKYIFKNFYSHDFHFPHEKLNNILSKKINSLINDYSYYENKYVLTDHVMKAINDEQFDVTFIKEYTKFCFRKIYLVYFLINSFSDEKDFDQYLYRNIKYSLMYFFNY